MPNMDSFKATCLAAIDKAESIDVLDAIRVDILGKKGRLSTQLKQLSTLPPDQRRQEGQELNMLKQLLGEAIQSRAKHLKARLMAETLSSQHVDTSLPPPPEQHGLTHPLSRVIEEIIAIFADMGFSLAEGPDIESDFYNFTALNMPPEHPARQEHDTFYLSPDAKGVRPVLRTHTSPVQIRTMMDTAAPIRIIVPGRTYRSDHDATHSPMFHQCEGLVIGDDIHMSHLKGCLIDFCRAFFGIDDLPVRFRPSFFPFTEPSAEVDIGCRRHDGQLEIGAGEDWLEILGSGMVHPRVLENCGLDPNQHQGFAFGMGVERLAMLKYGIADLRPFYESDLRWLRHYGFVPFDMPSLHTGVL